MMNRFVLFVPFVAFSSSTALNLPPLSSVYRVRPEFRPLLDAATQRDCLPKQFLPGASRLS